MTQMEKINAKKGGYFKENNSQLLLIVESFNNANIKFNNYVSDIEKQNKKIDTKIQEFNDTIDRLDIEKDAMIISSIQKKIINLNKLYLTNQKKIEDFNNITDEEKLRFQSDLLFGPIAVSANVDNKSSLEAKEPIGQTPANAKPRPITRKKQTIPSPKNPMEVSEISATLDKFNVRFQSQKLILNNYLSDKKLI